MKASCTMAAAAALLTLSALPAAAETLRLGYDVYVGGISLGRMTLETELADDRYHVAVGARANDLLDRLVHWSYTAEANGALSGPAGVAPDRFTSLRTLRNRKWEAVLDYSGDTVTHHQTPPQSEEDENAVPPELRPGTVDLLSASVAIALSAEASGGSCEARVPVFDGRRRYDVLAEPGKNRQLKKNSYNAYEGEAIGCRIEIDPVAGFRQARRGNDDFWTIPRDGSRRGFDLWLGRPQEGGPLVPVRLEARELFYADIIGHLATIETVDGTP
ncbi:DUF3108 domain-containing protein [Indioceanicola profundi]|uniref:DUF3108 domain-containing protein n=1 Tax=Indioceanicola profundi TaxID=2220096 RepID=UPI0013C4FE95|nr:DUF3108 domain-containing protein [Indioceanicola profundi]